MILTRMGNKRGIADTIQNYFPKHKIFLEPFFGAGGMFFNKPKVKYNIINDRDSDVYNLFNVVSNRKEELSEAFRIMPIHQDLFKFWKENKEEDEIRKAIRFLFLSNYGYLGKPETLAFGVENTKANFFINLDRVHGMIFDAQFSNLCFRDFFKVIGRIKEGDLPQTLIYCDPPYLGTDDNYSHSFTEADSLDLFNCLDETGCKYAMSEFDHPFILQQAKERGLNVVTIGERQNLKNRRTEILVMNYNQVPTLF